MTRWDRLCTTIYLSALGLWTGIIAMTAAAAAVTFPTVKALDPIVPALDPASRPHWLYIAGKVASGVFRISNVAQAVCAILVLVTVACLCRSREAGPRTRRSVSLYATGLAIALVGWYLLILWPRMRENLYTYWDNLNAGKLEAARVAQQAFDADHPISSNLFKALLAVVLVAFISGIWNALSHKARAK
jgi:hypothetical protein